MGAPDYFELFVEDDDRPFLGGQTIWGRLELVTKKLLTNITSVTIKLTGVAHVEFGDTSNGSLQQETETYIAEKIVVHSGNIDIGKHEYPFSFKLPENIPCSFDGGSSGGRGYVRYNIKAKIKRCGGIFSWLLHEEPYRFKEIMISALMDLNNISSSKKSVTVSKTEVVGSMLCSPGVVTTTVNIPRAGYTMGQYIPVSAKIANSSNVSLTTEAKLIQRMVLKVGRHEQVIDTQYKILSILAKS